MTDKEQIVEYILQLPIDQWREVNSPSNLHTYEINSNNLLIQLREIGSSGCPPQLHIEEYGLHIRI